MKIKALEIYNKIRKLYDFNKTNVLLANLI